MSKIFGVGLAKTGTLSLSKALGILGYRSVHDYRFAQELTDNLVNNNISHFKFLVRDIDCVIDIPDPITFTKYITWNTSTKLIQTTRPIEEWVNSSLLHVLYSRLTGKSPWIHIDTRDWIAYRHHLDQWITRVKDTYPSQVLVFDIREGWEPLCRFLDKPIPSTPFPHENKSIDRLKEILSHYEKQEGKGEGGDVSMDDGCRSTQQEQSHSASVDFGANP